MDGNAAADQMPMPRVPLFRRGANVCAIIYVLASVSLVVAAYGLFGPWAATWPLEAVFLGSVAILVIGGLVFLFQYFLRRDDGGGEIAVLPAPFTFTRDVLPEQGWTLCSICLGMVVEGMAVRQLPRCGHLFHADCIDESLRRHPTCPYCRDINA